MIRYIWLKIESIIGEHTLSVLLVQIVEKLFPLVSLWMVSRSFPDSVFDSFGLVIISVSTIVAWSTSGIGVCTTKSTIKNGGEELYKIGGLGRVMFIFTMIVYLCSKFFSNDLDMFSIMVICITGYYAALSIFRKSILIARFEWRLLFKSYLLSLSISVFYLIVDSKMEINYPEVSVFLFYSLLSFQLKTPINQQRITVKEVWNFFVKEVGPLYMTGIISGSLFYVMTQLAVYEDKSVGVTGGLAIGFQIITILQFLPMAMNRIHFINIAGGKEIQNKFEVIKLVILTLLSSFMFYFILPLMGVDYEVVGGGVYVFLSGAALFSILSTYFGNRIIINEKLKQWTIITFISTVLGVMSFYVVFDISVFEKVFMSLFIVYFIQFILAFLSNEKFRVFHF